MTSQSPRRWRSVLLAAAVFSLPVARAADLTWKNIQFGGFASQGYVQSSANDYIGSSSEGSFLFREYGANASWSAGKWRIGAQVFGQKLGIYGGDRPTLDWATIDYQAAQWFGVRVGRVKLPRGLYNEALDLDAVRPYVLLPASTYDARLRDFQAAFNGAMIYGNVGLKRVGSLDYKAYVGDTAIRTDSGANDYFNSDRIFVNGRLVMKSMHGGTVFWNTPVNGLKVGYSYTEYDHMRSTRAPDTPGQHYKSIEKYPRHLGSLEYTHGDWTFAAEGGTENSQFRIDLFFPTARTVFIHQWNHFYYMALSRRVNNWLEVGAYYDHYKEQSSNNLDRIQIDHALSARFDLNSHVSFKLEGHYYDGAGKIIDRIDYPQPIANRTKYWTMIAAKTSISF